MSTTFVMRCNGQCGELVPAIGIGFCDRCRKAWTDPMADGPPLPAIQKERPRDESRSRSISRVEADV